MTVTIRKWYRAHPAFVLRPLESGERQLRPEQLGFRWLKHSRAERRRQETAFFSQLFGAIGGGVGASLQADFSDIDNAESFARAWSLPRTERAVGGPCTAEMAAALVHERLEGAEIRDVDGNALLRVNGRHWRGVSVRLDADAAELMRTRLDAATRGAVGAEEPEVHEHPLRAALIITLAHASWIACVIVGVASMVLLDDIGVSRFIAVPVGVLLIPMLIVGPPGEASRRALDRLL